MTEKLEALGLMGESAGFTIGHVRELTLSVLEKNIHGMIQKGFYFILDILKSEQLRQYFDH